MRQAGVIALYWVCRFLWPAVRPGRVQKALAGLFNPEGITSPAWRRLATVVRVLLNAPLAVGFLLAGVVLRRPEVYALGLYGTGLGRLLNLFGVEVDPTVVMRRDLRRGYLEAARRAARRASGLAAAMPMIVNHASRRVEVAIRGTAGEGDSWISGMVVEGCSVSACEQVYRAIGKAWLYEGEIRDTYRFYKACSRPSTHFPENCACGEEQKSWPALELGWRVPRAGWVRRITGEDSAVVQVRSLFWVEVRPLEGGVLVRLRVTDSFWQGLSYKIRIPLLGDNGKEAKYGGSVLAASA